jgi:parallel beta-helix repeat protein
MRIVSATALFCALGAPVFAWAQDAPVTLSVRDADYAAKGDGRTDDTAAIQKALDAVRGTGGTVNIPSGVYMVNATAKGSCGLVVYGDTHLFLAKGAVLQAIPNAATSYGILKATGNGISITGGTLLGERGKHLGTKGEWGHGLILDGASHVTVTGVTAKECWGDGFYVTGCSNVALASLVADHNRRQGLSITGVSGMTVKQCTFKNTTGTQPEAGIDIEPNKGQTVADLLITGCTLTHNAGGGLQAGPPVAFAGLAFLVNVVIDGNTISGNGIGSVNGSIRDGVLISNCDGVKLLNNKIQGNTGRGILLRDKATHTLISGNTITGTIQIPGQPFWSGGGLYLGSCAGTKVSGNTVTGNGGFGIQNNSKDASITVSGNTVSGNKLTP